MDRVCADVLRRPNVLARGEIARDLDELVGRARVQRAAVVRGGDGDSRDPELAARSKDAKGDLAAVGHEELPDCHRVIVEPSC